MQTDADILAALCALPPETVADVREAARQVSYAAWCDRVVGNDPTADANTAAAARLSALADLLDGLREVPRG